MSDDLDPKCNRGAQDLKASKAFPLTIRRPHIRVIRLTGFQMPVEAAANKIMPQIRAKSWNCRGKQCVRRLVVIGIG